ncbi:hypothetical protein G6F70_002425 [Rhizopus microsporus]|uniref:Uncharacterized protein n=2 Tax=Rhizopus TaxID=4842 RepID=A0A367JUN5_RHIAZ|nr:hypothetical protein G6F71_006183 [Rhizopus microsporus]RCH93643.1 hypothetical protein CU097_005497 [Rhizopus azygosporus]KAG1202279.1 hypothetical protein G6F70_002425 [Rhizopus microsporus]KAG1209741.1 hypothetical protein G6F69_006082 [Rhizopus microsporus]KAG1231163.1 hypothetical protein G6F67_005944 [Rhizopus microsporus]
MVSTSDDDSIWEFDAPKFWNFTGETEQELPSDSWFSEKTVSGPSYPPHFYPPTPEAYTNRQTPAIARERLLDQSSSYNKKNESMTQKTSYDPLLSAPNNKKRPFGNDKNQQNIKSGASKKQRITSNVFSRLAQSNTIASISKMAKPPDMKHQAKLNHRNTTAVTKKPTTNKMNHTAITSATTTSRKLYSKQSEFVHRHVENSTVIDDPLSTEINPTVAKAQDSSTTHQKQSPRQEPISSTSHVSSNQDKKDDTPLPPYIPFTPPRQIIPDWFFFNSPEKATIAAIKDSPRKESPSFIKDQTSSPLQSKEKETRVPMFIQKNPFLEESPSVKKATNLPAPSRYTKLSTTGRYLNINNEPEGLLQSTENIKSPPKVVEKEDIRHIRHRRIIEDLRRRIYKKDPRHIRHKEIIEDLRLKVAKAVREAAEKNK